MECTKRCYAWEGMVINGIFIAVIAVIAFIVA